jgi:hypothetical protein
MKNKENALNFLKLNGFVLIETDTSAFFGDHYDIFTDGIIQLRFNSSKSFNTVEIRSNLPNKNWYDLALVRAMLHDEKDLNKVITIEDYWDFLQKELTSIAELFNNKNYPNTKLRLEELEDQRAKQMFPSFGVRIRGKDRG